MVNACLDEAVCAAELVYDELLQFPLIPLKGWAAGHQEFYAVLELRVAARKVFGRAF